MHRNKDSVFEKNMENVNIGLQMCTTIRNNVFGKTIENVNNQNLLHSVYDQQSFL